MHDTPTLERRFLEALPHVEAVLRHVARRYHLSPEEAEELAGRVKLRLIEDDYRVIRLFEERSQFRTYLTTVVTRLFLDERVRAWGKWRPSSEAKRLGPLAVSLERLIVRERLTVEEALETLCSRDPSCERTTLLALLERLPQRTASRRHVDDAELSTLPDPGPSPDAGVADNEAREGWRKARAALNEALKTFTARDRLLIQLRYFQSSRVSDIAKLVGEDQKPLYRRYEHLLAELGRALEERGVSRAMVVELFRNGVPDDSLNVPHLGIAGSASVSQDDDAGRATRAG